MNFDHFDLLSTLQHLVVVGHLAAFFGRALKREICWSRIIAIGTTVTQALASPPAHHHRHDSYPSPARAQRKDELLIIYFITLHAPALPQSQVSRARSSVTLEVRQPDFPVQK